jgi:hypothetical protein
MKALVVIATALTVGLIGWQMASPKADRTHPADLSDVPKQPPPTSTLTDPALVFQKAFWKRPTSQDQILHAERREWQDKDGLSKWQWFIAVKPGPALVDHLITDNAFMLVKAAKPLPADLPEWFQPPADTVSSYTNPGGTFHILWDKEKNLLPATDSGSGFRPGAPEPARAITEAQPEGRLPTTPPPKP